MRELFHSRRERRGDSTIVVPQADSSYSGLANHQQDQHRPLHQFPPVPRQGRSRHRTLYHEHPPLQRAPYHRGGGSRTSRSSHRSRSQPSTATMTEFRSIASTTVPSYINGTASGSRFSDDETSWMSGVESHARSVGGASTSSSASRSRRKPYLRDGKAIKRMIDGT